MKTFLARVFAWGVVLVAAVAMLGFGAGRPAKSATAAGIECPQGGQAGVPDLTGDPARTKLLLGGTGPDLINEISDLISEIQLQRPNISNAALENGLIAGYCPLVARAPGLTDAQRSDRMHRFAQLVQQQLAANELPPGSMIIAQIPVPPAVYRRLKSQAAAAGQTPAQFMGAILAGAAGNK